MPAPSVDLIFNTFNAYQRTAALKAAVELEVFTAIGEGHDTPAALARHSHASERGLRILCDFLVVDGLLAKSEGCYALSPAAALFLDKRSPAYLGGVAGFLNSRMLMQHFDQLTEAVRKGGTVMNPGGTMAVEHPIWVEFARSMMPLLRPAAEFIAATVKAAEAGPMKVLDIAAGHGLFGITIARQNPQATIYALDWPHVLDVAREHAQAAGLDGRYHTLAGSAFELEFGNGYDLVLLTNFFHHFDPETCRGLMEKVHRCLKPGGRAATLEFVPNDDRVTPPAAAAFSLIMLATTDSGDAYTFAEYDSMFRAAGFARNELHEIPDYPSRLIVSHR
jgi:SAM-dependent methyltransferase